MAVGLPVEFRDHVLHERHDVAEDVYAKNATTKEKKTERAKVFFFFSTAVVVSFRYAFFIIFFILCVF